MSCSKPFDDDLAFFLTPDNLIIARCVLEIHLYSVIEDGRHKKRRVIYLEDVARIASYFPFVWRIILDGAVVYERTHTVGAPIQASSVRVLTLRDCIPPPVWNVIRRCEEAY